MIIDGSRKNDGRERNVFSVLASVTVFLRRMDSEILTGYLLARCSVCRIRILILETVYLVLFDVVASIMSISCCVGSLNLLKKILQFHVLLRVGTLV